MLSPQSFFVSSHRPPPRQCNTLRLYLQEYKPLTIIFRYWWMHPRITRPPSKPRVLLKYSWLLQLHLSQWICGRWEDILQALKVGSLVLKMDGWCGALVYWQRFLTNSQFSSTNLSAPVYTRFKTLVRKSCLGWESVGDRLSRLAVYNGPIFLARLLFSSALHILWIYIMRNSTSTHQSCKLGNGRKNIVKWNTCYLIFLTPNWRKKREIEAVV